MQDANDVSSQIKDFSDLLDQIESLNDKKKALWKQIYHNAVFDRQNAYVMYVQLFKIVKDKSAEHAIHGKTIASFLERMSKSNDQLIRLADMIARAENQQATAEASEIDIFDRISEK